MAKSIFNISIFLNLNVISIFLLFSISFISSQSGDDEAIEHEYFETSDEAFMILDDESSGYVDIKKTNETSTNSNTSSYSLYQFDLLQNYLPLFIIVFEMPSKEKDTLEKYMNEKTYEKLKYNIDSKAKMYPEIINKNMNMSIENNSTIMNRTTFDETTNIVVQGYHNASIYNAIRSVWLKQLRPFLPIIDQMAIMQYFAQRKEAEIEKMSLWSRIWQNLSMWMYGRHDPRLECYAIEPKCVRAALEALSFEDRIKLDKAANENRFDLVDEILRNKLDEYQKGGDLDNWLHENRPPKSLESILDERTEVEEEALQRLRDNGIISSLKHYYKAVIETRNSFEQEEIRHFFDTMNDTFARCFDPLRGHFHDF